MIGSFIEQALQVLYLGDLRTKHVKMGYHKTRHIHNDIVTPQPLQG
jgi:hypothetical protein